MAPRRNLRYQSPGLMTRSFQSPRGLAGQEAARTTDLLARSLDRMADRFYEEAVADAKIEGAEYGAENPITLKQLQDAEKTGDDPLDDFDDTVFGRSAKKAALTALDNELTLEAADGFSQVMIDAEFQSLSLLEVAEKLDAVTAGLTSAAQNASPALAAKLRAEFGVTAAGHYRTYGKAKAAQNAKLAKATTQKVLSTQLDNMPEKIEAVLSDASSAQMVSEKLRAFETSQRNSAMTRATLTKFNRSETEGVINNFNSGFSTALINKVADEALSGDNATSIANKLARGAKTKDFVIDGIMAQLNEEDKATLIKKIRDGRRSQLSLAAAEETAKTQERQRKGDALYGNILSKAIAGDNYQNDMSSLKELDIKRAADLEKTIQGLQRGQQTDPLVERSLIELGSQASYNDLASAAPSLSTEKLLKYQKIIEGYEDKDVKDALDIIAGELEFDQAAIDLGDKDPQFDKRQVFKNIEGQLTQARLDARASEENFNAVAVAKELATQQTGEIKEVIRKNVIEKGERALKKVNQLRAQPGLPDLLLETAIDRLLELEALAQAKRPGKFKTQKTIKLQGLRKDLERQRDLD